MGLPALLKDNELFMWERIVFFVLVIASLLFNDSKYIFVFVSALHFLVIHSLYFYNFLRDYLETDCKMLEATSEGVERIYLSNGQRIVFIDHLKRRLWEVQQKTNEIEFSCEQKSRLNQLEKETMKNENNKLVERLQVFDEEKEIKTNNLLILEEKCSTLEKEYKKLLSCKIEKQMKISAYEDHCTTLVCKLAKIEEECAKLKEERCVLGNEHDDLERNRETQSVSELRGQCTKLEEENHILAHELEEQAKKLNEERQIVSELKEICATLELREERKAEELSIIAGDQNLQYIAEILNKALSEICDKSHKELKKLEDVDKKLREVKNVLGKKTSFFQKKLKKLKEEKRVWEAERENLLVVVDSQASIVEVYKDMLNKEECLMKLFSISR